LDSAAPRTSWSGNLGIRKIEVQPAKALEHDAPLRLPRLSGPHVQRSLYPAGNIHLQRNVISGAFSARIVLQRDWSFGGHGGATPDHENIIS